MSETKANPITVTYPVDHVALVTIDRPEARNAVNGAVAQGIHDAVTSTEADPDIWVVVLTGAGGKVFSAGADLKEVSAGRMASLGTSRGFAGLAQAERTKPWIAAVEGFALAGGTELALSCDMVVASEGSMFGLPEVTRGLVAAAGGLFRLARALPPAIATELVLTADRLSAERAAQFGMVNRLVPPGEAVKEALALASSIAANAPLAVRESLAVTRLANQLDDATLWKMSLAAQDRLKDTEDFAEGPLAFIEKRAPKWKGR